MSHKKIQQALMTALMVKALSNNNNNGGVNVNLGQGQGGTRINVFNINTNQPQNQPQQPGGSGNINFITQNNINNGGIQRVGQTGPGGVTAQA